MFAGLSPDELRLVAGTAQEVELMSTFVTPDEYRRFVSTCKALSVPAHQGLKEDLLCGRQQLFEGLEKGSWPRGRSGLVRG
jgi:hypothetical protein